MEGEPHGELVRLGWWIHRTDKKRSRERTTMMTTNVAKECANVQRCSKGSRVQRWLYVLPNAYCTFTCQHFPFFPMSTPVSGIRCLYCALKLQRWNGTSLALTSCVLLSLKLSRLVDDNPKVGALGWETLRPSFCNSPASWRSWR